MAGFAGLRAGIKNTIRKIKGKGRKGKGGQ